VDATFVVGFAAEAARVARLGGCNVISESPEDKLRKCHIIPCSSVLRRDLAEERAQARETLKSIRSIHKRQLQDRDNQ